MNPENFFAFANRVGLPRISYRVLRYAASRGYIAGGNLRAYCALLTFGFAPAEAAEMSHEAVSVGESRRTVSVDGEEYAVVVSRVRAADAA